MLAPATIVVTETKTRNPICHILACESISVPSFIARSRPTTVLLVLCYSIRRW